MFLFSSVICVSTPCTPTTAYQLLQTWNTNLKLLSLSPINCCLRDKEHCQKALHSKYLQKALETSRQNYCTWQLKSHVLCVTRYYFPKMKYLEYDSNRWVMWVGLQVYALHLYFVSMAPAALGRIEWSSQTQNLRDAVT